jgi:glycosyltransferase involved in cell wall biosynthesis
MKILYLTHGVPESQARGGNITSFYRIAQLARAGHEVVVFSLVTPEEADAGADELSRIARVETVTAVPRASAWRYLVNLLDPLPWPIRKYVSRAADRRVREILSNERFDLVIGHSIHSATRLEAVRSATAAPFLLFAPNVQATIMDLYWRHLRNPASRLYARIQWGKTAAYEGAMASRFDRVLVYSEADRAGLLELSPEAEVEIVPVALDVAALARGEETEETDILFVGYFGWAPNLDSLSWFLDEILPLVHERRPETDVAIVGAGAPAWVGRLGERDTRIRVHGWVEDAAPYFRRSRVVVVPLRIGSGVRVKIVQAMAMGRAIVTTSKGCEGLEVASGEHLVVADEPSAFADEVVRLLDSPEERRALGSRGRELAFEKHDAMKDRAPLVELCERIVRERAAEERC